MRAVPLAPRTDDATGQAQPLTAERHAAGRRVNFDGLPGPTHNYSGLARGNLAAERNAQQVANPREAALQGLAKMRALAARGYPQAVLPPHERPNVRRVARARLCAAATHDVIAARRHATRRSCSPHARRPRRCGRPTRRPSAPSADTRRRPRAFHAGESRRRISIARSKRRRRRACCARSSPTPRASRARSAAGRAAVRRRRRRQPHALLPRARRSPASSSSSTGGAAYRRRRARRRASRRGRRAKRPRPSRAGTGSIRRARVFAQQNPDAIDAGVFHNDVIAVGDGTRCSATSGVAVDQAGGAGQRLRDAHRRRVSSRSSCATTSCRSPTPWPPTSSTASCCRAPTAAILLVAPAECREHARVAAFSTSWSTRTGRSPKSSHSICARACATAADRRACGCASPLTGASSDSRRAHVFLDAARRRARRWIRRTTATGSRRRICAIPPCSTNRGAQLDELTQSLGFRRCTRFSWRLDMPGRVVRCLQRD